jgi:predicted nucleic acid-binding protein
LVAILRPDDAHHAACVREARLLRYPFQTSWAVLTEAAWLLRQTSTGISRLLDQVGKGLILPLDLKPAAAPWIAGFLDKYRDLGAQLADATLCYLAEREKINLVFTLDRRDFSVFRTEQGKAFTLVPGQ